MKTIPPNVIFVLTDDQGYPPLGCHGHPFIQTPHLDAFHGDAVRFDQFHTGTTCAPTRAGLMTGHYCNSTGVWHTIGGRSLLRRDEWTLPAALAENGYATGLFGKWHLGDDWPYRPQDRGFQTTVCHGGGGVSQQADWWGNDYFDDTYRVDGEPRAFDGYCTDVFFREALTFIEANRERPFFCMISTNAPHSPFNVEPRYRDLYFGPHTDTEDLARFLGMITNIDENFGRLREKLGEFDLEDSTILVFMSDNGQDWIGGQDFNCGMRGVKGSPYDGGHRVPFFLRWPGGGVDRPQTIDTLTAYVDFMPTILDLCGIAPPAERTFHGRSLAPLLRGETAPDAPDWRERIVVTDTQRIAHPLKWRLSCVMQDTWRLVNRTELYDLAGDPGQERDLAATHPERVATLRRAYEEWWDICRWQMDADIPFIIGAKDQPEVVLRTHDMRSTEMVVWNQRAVRVGDVCHGHWELQVETPGTYTFSLRRWPVESGHAVAAGIDGDDVPFRRDGIMPGCENWYSGGAALPFDTATLQIDDLPRDELPVAEDCEEVRFQVPLTMGRHRIQARFSSASGLCMAAYYVTVRTLCR